MPFGILVFVTDILLIIHAARSGRFQPWVYIIMLLPGIGSLAYVFVELVPEWMGSHEGMRTRRRLTKTIDPERNYRVLSENLKSLDTIANRIALADECLQTARYQEALTLYESVTALPLGHEPQFVVSEARAEFGLGRPADAIRTLEYVRGTWPEYNTADGHLLYARALEAADRIDEALHEYAEVSQYFPGAEPRVRRAALLARLGRADEARAVAEEVVHALKRAPRHLREQQKPWLNEAIRVARA